MKKSSVRQQADFFNLLGSDYIDTVAKEYATIYARTFNAINSHITGDLLDIGSGGVNLFSTSGNHVFYDISTVLLYAHNTSLYAHNTSLPADNISIDKNKSDFKVCGESANLPFLSNSFDTVLFHFSIHHFAQETFYLTLNYIRQAIEEAKRVLRHGGKIIIAENTVGNFVEMAESLLFPVVSKILQILNYPPVFLFSERRLAEILTSVVSTPLSPLLINKKIVELESKPILLSSFKEASRLLVSPLNIQLLLNPVTIKVFVISNV